MTVAWVQPFESTCVTRQPTAFAMTRMHVRHKDPDAPIRILHLEDEPKDADLIRCALEAGGLNCVITPGRMGGTNPSPGPRADRPGASDRHVHRPDQLGRGIPGATRGRIL